MQSITFTCKVITPMFLAGADGRTPELRGSSIKGAIRFWWRAMHAHFKLEKLRQQEAEIFGGTDGSGRSKVIIRVEQPKLNITPSALVPHKPRMKAPAIQPGQVFDITLMLTRELPNFTLKHLKSLFSIVCTLGGFGKRVRRGMGSVQIINSSDGEQIPKNIDLTYILKELNSFSSYYTLVGNGIAFSYNGRTSNYPFIKQIEIGSHKNNLLKAISNATHDVKQKDPYAYEPSMGHAYKGRFASPVYTSTIDGKRAIITTLNAAPDKNWDKVSEDIQNEFKRKVL